MTSNSEVDKRKAYKQNKYKNIIKFLDNGNVDFDDLNHSFVSEYADSNTLENYLKDNFNMLVWDTKLQFAIQIADAISYMHKANIIHNNLAIHRNMIKLADFGLSRRACYSDSLTPYLDPQRFQERAIVCHYKENEKSDVYSVGVLLWEISSGKKPFKFNTICNRIWELMFEISRGKREVPVPNTPIDYVNLYKKCWQHNPDDRPDMEQVLSNLKLINLNTNEILTNDLLPLYEGSIQNGMNEKDCIQLIKQHVNSKNKSEDEIFNYLLNCKDRQQNIVIFLAKLYQHGIGTEKNEIKAFELYKEAYEKNHISSMYMLGHCYKYGIGTENNDSKAFEKHAKETMLTPSANRGHVNSISNLGYCYQFGIGTKKDEIEAIKLYKKAAERSNVYRTSIVYDSDSDNDNLMSLDYTVDEEIFDQSSENDDNSMDFDYVEQSSSRTLKNFMKLFESLENDDDLMDFDHNEISDQSSSRTLKNIFECSNEQIIRHFKLNHGIIITGENIRPSVRAINVKDGELKMSLYKGQPLVYTISSDNDGPFDMCINFPIVEIIYNGNLVESFSKYKDNDETLHEFYGHFLVRRFLAGGQLFIKDFNLATSTQIDILKFYLYYVYNSAKYSLEIQLNDLFNLNLLPKIVAMDGELLNTHEKLTKWMNDLCQRKIVAIISYNNLIPVTQLKHSELSIDDLETFNEKQPGVANFVRRLSLEEWIGDEVHDNLMSWTENFNLFQGLIFNNNHEIEISKKVAINFVEIPQVNFNDKSYCNLIIPSTNIEVNLISNKIFSTKDLSTLPFIKSNVKNYEDHAHILLKCERYEILLNKEHVKPTKEFEQLIENALNSMNPLEALQNIFNEYGHIFPQRIVLGRSLKSILSGSHICTKGTIDFILESPLIESLKHRLDCLNILYSLNISYFLTQEGEVVEKNDLFNWIQNTNNNLEIIEFDNIIPLYEILEIEQQRKIDNILKNDSRIIMTGITDLKDLDNNNIVHFKRINLNSKSVLKDEDYEVFGSIITENNAKLEDIYVNFGLFDLNGFHAIIKKSKKTSIVITKCYVLWMIVGNPSKLSTFSPNNRDFQVNCARTSIKLQTGKSNYYIKTPPLPISQEYNNTISVHAYYPSTNYEPINIIKIIGWNDKYIKFQITYNEDDAHLNGVKIELHICYLSTTHKNLKIDYEERECSLNLIGYTLAKKNLNYKLPNEIKSEAKSGLTSDSDIEMVIDDERTSSRMNMNTNKDVIRVPHKKSKKCIIKSEDLIKVLNFINDNFGIWYRNHKTACKKAMEVNNINRDNKALYNKIHSTFKAVIKLNKTGTNNAIIWENDKIYELVMKIYEKTKERENNEERILAKKRKNDEKRIPAKKRKNNKKRRNKKRKNNKKGKNNEVQINTNNVNKMTINDKVTPDYSSEICDMVNKIGNEMRVNFNKLHETIGHIDKLRNEISELSEKLQNMDN
ncbi:hypothetical protein RclHR1_01340019 [Rhizophagus clarus]|uniref:Protein kinase domain-containing protein n=1 Tax=Rhizophagus clarus TaxID=94130 RepID=A0A2Z6QEE1_9GLOM|nr:hypothetical protein RclHR1_01340019 [Rhizophagus clarus]